MRNINSFSILIIIILLFSFTSLFSQDNISKWRIQVAEKEQQLNKLNLEINSVQEKKHQIESSLASAGKDRKDKKSVYDKAKDAYERASKNVDLISADDLTNLLKEYKTADKEYKSAQEKEQELKNEKSKFESDIERLNNQKRKQEIQILELRAKMLDEEMSKPVWSEGSGESILDENKTINECKKLALEYAKRDAMDKGGKTIIESVTKVEDFMLIKDEIKSQAKVQIVEQDVSGDYGKAIRIMHGDMIKYTAKVKLKLKSVDSFNPYRQRISQLKIEDIKSISGLVAYYPFNGNANDESKNNNDGIVHGAILTKDRYSNINSAYKFDGHNDYIEIPNSSRIDTRYSISIFAWINSEGKDGPIVNYCSNCWGVHFWIVNGNGLFVRFVRRDLDLTTYLSMGNIILKDQWEFVGATYDYSTGIAKLWHNGREIKSLNVGKITLATQFPIRIGFRDGDSRIYKGEIDDIRIYNRALSIKEIEELYSKKY